jgi:5-methylcytosine-specific restriction endonuclease McrA
MTIRSGASAKRRRERSGVPGWLGRIRLKGLAMADLRRQCFTRDGWKCVECARPVSWATGHMAHIKSRGAGGSDVLENVRTKCAECHHAEHNPKAVPAKAR